MSVPKLFVIIHKTFGNDGVSEAIEYRVNYLAETMPDAQHPRRTRGLGKSMKGVDGPVYVSSETEALNLWSEFIERKKAARVSAILS